MKNIQWGINILFAILIGYLMINGLSGNVESEKTTSVKNKKDTTAINSVGSGLEIRYINSDTIYVKFKMVEDLRKDLEGRQKQYSSSLEGRVKAFEQEVVSFQQNAQTMSQFEGQQRQKELMAKEQELGEMQQDLSGKLLEMETKMQKDIRSNVLEYLESYKARGIDLILDYSSNSSLLMVQESLDITTEVLDSLNLNYEASKLK